MAASLSAAAAILECSISILKKAKKLGAPGFRSNGSVCISELRPWLEANMERIAGDDSKEALECRRLIAQCEKLEYQNEVERGNYTHNDIVHSHGLQLGALVDSETMRFVADAPTFAGLPPDEIERRVKALREKMRAEFRRAIEKIK